MDLVGDRKNEHFIGHILKGAANYRLWKFQTMAYMRANALTDNIAGNVPAENAEAKVKSQFDRNEGKAMNAIIQSLDAEHGNLVLTCTTAKDMMDKLSSIYDKSSEIRTMTLYEDYFTAKMRDDESIASFVARVNQLASEIEQQNEKLSENLKMARITTGLTAKFNNYKTVWYNTKENRTLNELMSSLQLEEENLNRLNGEEISKSNVAFSAKSKSSKQNSFKVKSKIDDLKKKTKCNACGQKGHWAKDKCCPKYGKSSDKQEKGKGNEAKGELAWCTSEYSTESSNKESSCWYADSAASKHMTFHREWFSELREYTGKSKVKVANNSMLKIAGIGTILIDAKVGNQWKPIRLEDVLYVPELGENLFSTGVVTDKGIRIIQDSKGCKFIDEANNVVAVGKREEMNQLKMDFRLRIGEFANAASFSLEHWHRRLGHINVNSIKKMSSDGSVSGLDFTDSEKFFCEDCQYGKMTRATHKQCVKRSSVRGEYMHVDLCGPSEVNGIDGVRYFMLVKDEATSFRFVFLLKSKDEAYSHLKTLVPLVKNMVGAQIKHFRFDNGKEFFNRRVLVDLLEKEGIQVECITPYTPEQNGRIERDNRTVQESARTMLIASDLSKSLWSEAVRTAVYLLNRTTNSSCDGSTPYEKWFGRKPYLGHVKIFGTECFVQIPKQIGRKKWDPKAKKVHLVGYEPTIKNYRLYDPSSGKILISCDVRFNEKQIRRYVIQDEPETENLEAVSLDDEEQSEESYETAQDSTDEANLNETSDNRVNQEERNNERYNLRPKVSAPDRLIEMGYSAIMCEPSTYEQAMASDQKQQWKHAMDDEYESLMKNDTWELVQPPKDQKQSEYDPCVFIHRDENKITVIAIYVDDGIVASNTAAESDAIIQHLQKHFEVKVFEVERFLGLEIDQMCDGSIRIHQEAYAKKVLHRFNMIDCNQVSSPMDCNQNLSDFVNDECDKTYPYREAVGSLMYLSIGTRPDITFAVGVVSRYLERPAPAHVNAVKRILKYIKGSISTGILYKANHEFDFVGYSDADYAGDTETRKSTSGYVFHIGSGVVSWASEKQQSVSTSSTESEYVAACQAVKELVWLKGLMSEFSM